MHKLDLFISNSGHHVAMFLPVLERLSADPAYQCRVLSLCEFRGMNSPSERFIMERVDFVELLPLRARTSPVGKRAGKLQSSKLRGLARRVTWQTLLRPALDHHFQAMTDLVLLPNDAAYPYDYICAYLKRKQLPFLLVQEGIRFPQKFSDDPGARNQGKGGADAIAAWGKKSAHFFQDKGVPPGRIHLTGNPRFDVIMRTNWACEAEAMKKELNLGNRNMLFLSNPIDDQGFCSTKEKMELVRRFLLGITPLFADPELHLIIKLHTREAVSDFQEVVAGTSYADRVTILRESPLYPLFVLSQAAVIFASSVGLEAMLFGLPLGILELPKVGFAYDYVSSGSGLGLYLDDTLAERVGELLQQRGAENPVVEAYLDDNLATRHDATARIVELVARLSDGSRSSKTPLSAA